jgi:hypothetical protein
VCWVGLMRDEARLGYFEVMAKELPRFTENFVRLLGVASVEPAFDGGVVGRVCGDDERLDEREGDAFLSEGDWDR